MIRRKKYTARKLVDPHSSISFSPGRRRNLPGVRPMANPSPTSTPGSKRRRAGARAREGASEVSEGPRLLVNQAADARPPGPARSLHIKRISTAYTSHPLTASGRTPSSEASQASVSKRREKKKTRLVSEGGQRLKKNGRVTCIPSAIQISPGNTQPIWANLR